MKKLGLIIGLVLFIIGIVFTIVFLTRAKVVENYELIKFKTNTVKVYEEINLGSLLELPGGKLIDQDIDSKKLGTKTIEVFYEKDKKKYKALFDIEIIDDTAPIVLGASTFTFKKGNNIDYGKLFLIADNYDKDPSWEVIGKCDSKVDSVCFLTMIVKDQSKNETRKDFKINYVDKLNTSTSTSSRALIKYEDVIAKWKRNDTMIGLDVSKWQGEIDFSKIKNAGTEFIMIRVGTQKGFGKDSRLDEYFKRNISEANKYAIPVGVYYFSYATSIKEAKEQAKWVLEQIKDYDVSFPVVFDWESWKYFNDLGMSLYDINNVASTFLSKVKDAGYKVMNYSSKYYEENIWDIDYPLWLAHYTKETNYSGKYDMWQLGDTGRIDGVKGNVDINVYFRKGRN